MDELQIDTTRYTAAEVQEILDSLYSMEAFGYDVPSTQAELDQYCEDYFE